MDCQSSRINLPSSAAGQEQQINAVPCSGSTIGGSAYWTLPLLTTVWQVDAATPIFTVQAFQHRNHRRNSNAQGRPARSIEPIIRNGICS